MSDHPALSPRVFLGYAYQDTWLAHHLALELQDAGADVWCDNQSVHLTAEYEAVITHEIASREIFLVLLSQDAIASVWVRHICELAEGQYKLGNIRKLIVIRLFLCDVPASLQQYPLIDMTAGKLEDGISELLHGIGVKADRQAPKSVSPGRHEPHPPTLYSPSRSVCYLPAGEDILFSAFHPREVRTEEWHSLLVYGYVASAMRSINEDMERFRNEIGTYPRTGHALAALHIPVGTSVRVVPRMSAVQFNPQYITFAWTEAWHRHLFRFKASNHLSGAVGNGEVSVYLEQNGLLLLIAVIRIAMSFTASSLVPSTSIAWTHPDVQAPSYMFKSIFASYCHEDALIVYACCQAYRALGITVHIDVESLRSGTYFRHTLKRLIESSDVFQLFWSTRAARSAMVREEWQYALRCNRGEGFIRPVFWELPMASPPPELAYIHFARLNLEG